MTTKEIDVADVIHDLCSNWNEWSDKLNNTEASLFDLVRQKYPNTKGIYLAVESVWYTMFNRKYYKEC